MTTQKQTVYLPVNGDYITAVCTFENDWVHQETVESREGYFFTPEQLNEYTANVIKQALETAAEKVFIDFEDVDDYSEISSDGIVNKQSITNTFEETYNKLKV